MPFNTYRFALPSRYFLEPIAGVIALWPLALAAFAMPGWLRKCPRGNPARTVLWTVYLTANIVLLFIAVTGLISQRFSMDFLPALILISCVAIAVLNRPGVTALAAVLMLYSVAVGLAIGVQGPFDDFIHSKPERYARLAQRFSPVPRFRPLLNPALVAEASFDFPDPGSHEEPLVTAGYFGSRYSLSAEPLGGGRWRLISEMARWFGSRTTAEVTVKPKEPNRLRLEFTPQNRTMTVRWNGEEVIRHQLEYLITAPAQVRVGIDRTELGMDVPDFSGRIVQSSLTIAAH